MSGLIDCTDLCTCLVKREIKFNLLLEMEVSLEEGQLNRKKVILFK
jgi:hypothetical protein